MTLKEYSYPITWQKSVVRNFCEVPLDRPSPYASIEIQQAENNGRAGFIAILNHGNRELDVLYEGQLALDEQWVLTEPATAHLKVRNLQAIEFSAVNCFVSASEVNVYANFVDLKQRHIEFLVKHRFASVNRPMFTPAPPQREPFGLRFLTMDVFHLLPVQAEIKVLLDGAALPSSAFVLPKNISPYLSTRVGGSLLLTSLVYTGDISRHGASSSNSGPLRITDRDLWMEIVGLPTLNELSSLSIGDVLLGEFVVDSSLGNLASGSYQCVLSDVGLDFQLKNVAQDWKPGWRSPLRCIMRLVRKYNRRNERWVFGVAESEDGDNHLRSVIGWKNG